MDQFYWHLVEGVCGVVFGLSTFFVGRGYESSKTKTPKLRQVFRSLQTGARSNTRIVILDMQVDDVICKVVGSDAKFQTKWADFIKNYEPMNLKTKV